LGLVDVGRRTLKTRQISPKGRKSREDLNRIFFFPVFPWNLIKGAFVSSGMAHFHQDPEPMGWLNFRRQLQVEWLFEVLILGGKWWVHSSAQLWVGLVVSSGHVPSLQSLSKALPLR
jgi:hypothetical protein